jgi:DnaJ-domain-containing protein 1
MNMGAENHYDTLGIGPGADDEEVKQAFRELAKTYHPDHNPGNDEAERRFKQVNVAYESLKDEARRQAYNEFLDFAERQKNFKRVQWGRLIALIFVLLLGPSAVLFWLAIPRDIAVVQSADPAIPAPAPTPIAKAEPAVKVEPAAPPPAPEAKAPDHAATTKEKDIAAADHIKPAPVPPTPAPAPVEQQASPAVVPPIPEKDVAAKDPPVVESKDTSRQAKRRFEVFQKDQPADAPDSTQALPRSADSAAPNPQPPAPADEQSDTTARGAARLLAELKEPENASSRSRSTNDAVPPRSLASRQDGSDTEPFSDCPYCPVMSLTRRATPTRRGGELAVSQSEVTVRQWNACVEDRICSPYRSVDGDAGAPVVGLSERAASQYARWLSEITGHPYSVVMPLSSQPRPQPEAAGCVERGRTGSQWDWLDDAPDRDCPPSAARNRTRDKPQGFRVARRVIKDG